MLFPDLSRDEMQDRILLRVFLILNLTLAIVFVFYLCLPGQRSRGAKVVSSSDLIANAVQREFSVAGPEALRGLSATESAQASTNFSLPTQPGRQTTWREVGTREYPAYIARVRLAGCPEETVRRLVLSDVDAWFADRRVQIAVSLDSEWWRVDPPAVAAQGWSTLGRALEEERAALLATLLGHDAGTDFVLVEWWSDVPLGGAVLGALSPAVHQSVQQIYRRSLERQQSRVSAQGEGTSNGLALARIRDETRKEFAEILSTEALEEFLLRYSQRASRLREELREFKPSAAEFRGIFAAVDPLDRQLQLELGGPSSLSPIQAARYEHQRTAALQAILSESRFQAYTRTRKQAEVGSGWSVVQK